MSYMELAARRQREVTSRHNNGAGQKEPQGKKTFVDWAFAPANHEVLIRMSETRRLGGAKMRKEFPSANKAKDFFSLALKCWGLTSRDIADLGNGVKVARIRPNILTEEEINQAMSEIFS